MASSSSSPSSQSLLSLSQIPELLDQITLDVGSTQDLASMALASRQLSEIARRQLRYRDIRARLANKALWDHLAKDKVSAAAVRRLELIRDEQHPSGRLKLPAERVPCDQLRVADSQSTRYEPHTLDLDTIRKHVEIDKQAESALIAALPHMVNMEV